MVRKKASDIKQRTVKTSNQIAKLRERKALRQRDIADRVGVGESTIANWEQGRSIDTILKVQRLCIGLKCQIDQLTKEEKFTKEEIISMFQDEEYRKRVRLAKHKSEIAKLRKELGLTQRKLADLVGVTESTVANWEQGRRGFDKIVQIKELCKALECDVRQLIQVKVDRPTKEQLLAAYRKDPEAYLRGKPKL